MSYRRRFSLTLCCLALSAVVHSLLATIWPVGNVMDWRSASPVSEIILGGMVVETESDEATDPSEEGLALRQTDLSLHFPGRPNRQSVTPTTSSGVRSASPSAPTIGIGEPRSSVIARQPPAETRTPEAAAASVSSSAQAIEPKSTTTPSPVSSPSFPVRITGSDPSVTSTMPTDGFSSSASAGGAALAAGAIAMVRQSGSSVGLQEGRRPAAPRKQVITQATRDVRLRQYAEDWRRKVERVGKLGYPSETGETALTGKVLVRVIIAADGSLKQAIILKSSTNETLDAGARRIVEMAAPYAPFPVSFRDEYDLIEISRWWSFTEVFSGGGQ